MYAITPTIRTMTFEEATQAGLHNRGLILEHLGQSYRLNAGTSDTIHVFAQSIVLYVLTLNSSLGYMGLDAYMLTESDPINTIFLHNTQDMKDALGASYARLSAKTIAMKLTNHLI